MRISPMFPLGSVLLPGADLSLQVFEPRYIEMVQHCTDTGNLEFGVVLIARGSEVGGADVRTDIGTLARIESRSRLPGNRIGLTCKGEDRFRVERWLADAPYPQAVIELWPDDADGDDSEALAAVFDKRSQAFTLWRELAKRAGKQIPEFTEPPLPTDPSARSFAVAAGLPISDADRHRALAADGPVARLGVLAQSMDDVIATLKFRLM